MESFKRHALLGRHRYGDAWLTIDWTAPGDTHIGQVRDAGCLSLTGQIGPKRNGDAEGSSGQIVDELDPADFNSFAEGWSAELVDRVRETWKRWHLNDMRAGTPEQEARLRELKYDRARHGSDHYPWAKAELERADLQPQVIGTKEHTAETCPGRPCSTDCDHVETLTYSYGSAWLSEVVPEDVLAFLKELPEVPARRVHPWRSRGLS